MVSKTSETECPNAGDTGNSSRFLLQVEKDAELQEKEQPGEDDTDSVGTDTLVCGPRLPNLKDVDVFNLRASAGMGAFLCDEPTDNGPEPVWVKRDPSKHDRLENSHPRKSHDIQQENNNKQDRSGNTVGRRVSDIEREQDQNRLLETSERDRRRSESTPGKEPTSDSPGETPAAAPDGGWGWMIVLAAFIVETCLGGFARAVGVFFVEFVDAFDVGSADISWSISIMCGITFCGGLVSSILCRRFGARPLVMIGGIVGSAGLFLSSFSTTIVHLHLSLGLTSGLGFALVYNPTFIMVGQYFHKKRHLAYAMMVTGTGVGGFIFSPVFQLLIDHYGWRGAIIVQAGVTLHLCVAAALMRPLHVPPVRGPSQTYISQDSLSSAPTSHHGFSNHPNPTVYVTAPLEREEADKISQKTSEENEADISQDQEPTAPAAGSPAPLVRRQRGVSECSIGAVSLRLLEPASSQESLPCIPEMTEDASYRRLDSVSVSAVRAARSGSMTLSRRMLYSSQRMLDVLSRSETLLSLSSQLTYETTIHTKLAGKPGLSVHSIVSTLFDLSLMKSVPFVLLSISFFMFHLGYLVPGIGVVPRAQRAGIEETQVSFLPSIISISDLVGRLLSGGLSKIPGCSRTFQFITLNVIIAVGAVVFPVTQTYSGMAAYAVWHGLANGLCYPLIPTLVVDVAGVERIASAMGMVMFITSIGLTLGLPIAGILYDTTGSYDVSFYFVGACFLLSAAVLAFSHILSIRRQDSRPEES
ncbi:monocarboxylate transporter 13-like [Branchiostoma lanceolatum]|uniref:monocarboxylate transporter 13-like n=1 Tax=Branchiostoma lanceolatum TaxID=7740 RepID=UPI00345726A6